VKEMRRLATWMLAAAALLVGACASTTLKDSWADPSFDQGPLRQWIVIAGGAPAASTRTFEDIAVEALRARGVTAVPGYRYLPEGRASERELDDAVARSAADAMLMVHLRRVQTRTQVTQTMVPAGPGWYGFYGGWFAVPDVRQYDIATVEINAYAVNGRRLVWSGVTETFDPGTIAHEAPGFMKIILDAMALHRIVPAAAQ
jgi:hypothetical protein